MKRSGQLLSRTQTCLFFAALLHVSLSHASPSWDPSTFPNPQTDPARCGRSHVAKSWVCDPDKILMKKSADVIEGILKDIADANDPYVPAKNCGAGQRVNEGYQVAVALAKEIKVPQGTEAGAAAESFARKLMDSWGVGDAACNDGVVLLLSQEPRQVAIFAGEGSKGTLDRKRIQDIIGTMRPLLRSGRYGQAVEGAAVDIGIALAGGGGGSNVWGIVTSILFFGLFFTVLVTSCLQSHKRHKQKNECQRLLEKLKREQAIAAATHQYPAASCPVCLEDFDGSAERRDPAAVAPSAPPLNAMRAQGKAAEGTEDSRESDAELSKKLLDASMDRSAPSGAASCKPLVLPCGHTLCEPCISKWLKDHNTCPMCRTPLTGGERSAADQQSQRSVWDANNVENELLFRLGSLQRMYPYIITADIAAAWAAQVRGGAALDWVEVRADQLSSEARHAHAASGAFGASTDFGGGSSSGGAGASGSW